MIDTIDYERLFNQLRSENEVLRLTILRLRNSSPGLIQKFSEWFVDFIGDESNKQIVVTFAIIIFVSFVVPTLKSFCVITFRSFINER